MKLLKSYVARVETTLWSLTNPEQHQQLTTFKYGLLRASRPLRDHVVIFDLIFHSIEIYHETKVIISRHIQIDETRSLCIVASKQLKTSKRGKLGLPQAKKKHVNSDSKDQTHALPVRTTSIVLIC